MKNQKMGISHSCEEYKNIIQLEDDIKYLEKLSSKRQYSTYDNIKIILISGRIQDNLNDAYVLLSKCGDDRELYSYMLGLIDKALVVINKFNASSY